MKFLGFVLAGIFAAGTCASAQVVSSSMLMPNPAAAAAVSAANAAPEPSTAALPAAPVPSSSSAAEPMPNTDAVAFPDSAASSSATPYPQRGPVGVFENYNFQAYLGYTFFRFYEAPHLIQSRNGFDSSIAYYLNSGWFGVDGSLFGGFGDQGPYRSRFVFAGGGPRFRWSGDRALEYWAHVLVGGAHYTPQTAFGGQGAFAYEAGLGVDATAHHRRLAYRLELDMIGSRFFNTYQYSPKVSAGIVFKF